MIKLMKRFWIISLLSLIYFLIFLPANADFQLNFAKGSRSPLIKLAQQILNLDSMTTVATTGAGSLGRETSYFNEKTRLAIIVFQKKYKITGETGRIGPKTYGKLLEVAERKIKAMQEEVANKQNNPSNSQLPKSLAPSLSYLSPTSGGYDALVRVNGQGFTKTGNTVKTSYGYINDVTSADGQSLAFAFALPSPTELAKTGLSQLPTDAPASISVPLRIKVINSNGESNELIFNWQVR